MKRKLFLLPITLTALAPAISLVGCGGDEPESEYINVEIKNNTSIDSFPLYKNKCYKFYNDAWDNDFGSFTMILWPDYEINKIFDIDVIKVEINNREVESYEAHKREEKWVLDLNGVIKNKNYAIYVKSNVEVINCYGTIGA